MKKCSDCASNLTCGSLCRNLARSLQRVEINFGSRVMRFADMNDFRRTDVSVFIFSRYPYADRYDEESLS